MFPLLLFAGTVLCGLARPTQQLWQAHGWFCLVTPSSGWIFDMETTPEMVWASNSFMWIWYLAVFFHPLLVLWDWGLWLQQSLLSLEGKDFGSYNFLAPFKLWTSWRIPALPGWSTQGNTSNLLLWIDVSDTHLWTSVHFFENWKET